MALPAISPSSNWKLPNLASLPSWSGASRVCVDLETRDPNLTKLGPGVRRKDGYVVGLGFAIDGGPAEYLPIAHGNGRNLDPEHVLSYFRDQARDFKGEIVGANLPYDMDWMAELGIVFRNASFFRDVTIAEPLLDELQFSYGLGAIASRRGIEGKDERVLNQAAAAWGVHPKKGLWELPPELVAEYGIQDCRVPLAVLAEQEKELAAQDLLGVWDLESKLLPVLLKMRRRGVRIDFDNLEQVESWAEEREISALARITHITGIPLTVSDTTKTSSLVPVLRHIGLDIPKTEKGNDSITNPWIRELPAHPVTDAVVEARKFNKLRTTFVQSIRTHAVGDRIHCTFKQMVGESEGDDAVSGAKYGRLSCKDPNLQQQPARDPDIGPVWRQIYLPDDGAEWACLDYSQQEPRWTAHFAELLKLPKAKQMADEYRDNPNADTHNMVATLINPNWPNLDPKQKKQERDSGKVVNLGLSYGMGPGKLAKSLGLPTVMKSFVNKEGEEITYLGAGPEAQDILDRFQTGVPFIKKLMWAAEKVAAERGYVLTVEGRRCRFHKLAKPYRKRGIIYRYRDAHKAGNRVIQGSAGGQMKTSMVMLDEAGISLQLQVHDEVDFSFTDREVVKQAAEIMRNAVPCNVPHVVDVEVGPNWGSIKKPDWS